MLNSNALFTAELPGRPIVKKNTQRVVGVGRKKRVIYSARYIAWRNSVFCHLSGARLRDPISTSVELYLTFFFQNRAAEADVSNLIEGPQDILVQAGILKDDKLIRKVTAEKVFNHPPKTLIQIYEFKEAV